MLDVRRLSVLREVARQGSFSRAAESLGYTQPAISRQIAILERETGATLVDRRPDGVRLTDAGELLVARAEAVLGLLEDAEAELQELLGMASGRLRMSTLTSAAATIMPQAIAAFRKRLPGVELSVSMVDPVGVVPALRAGELDLALCNDPAHGDFGDIDSLHLFDEPMLIALPPGHPLGLRDALRLRELAGERWMLGTTTACPDAGRFIRACHTAGFEPEIAFHNDDYGAILGFVAAGVGVAPVPEMVARSAPRNVQICELASNRLTRPIVVSLRAGYRPGPVREMIEVLGEVGERWTRRQREPIAA
jgi:DNA-binding transcriptional LysR family regulator